MTVYIRTVTGGLRTVILILSDRAGIIREKAHARLAEILKTRFFQRLTVKFLRSSRTVRVNRNQSGRGKIGNNL
jgi:hypothetical protein